MGIFVAMSGTAAVTDDRRLVQDGIPVDTFGVRLAIVRVAALNGANVAEAARICDLNDESWRRWESGSHPRNYEQVCREIADAAGVDLAWLMMGGGLRTGSYLTPVWMDAGQMTLPLGIEAPVLTVAS